MIGITDDFVLGACYQNENTVVNPEPYKLVIFDEQLMSFRCAVLSVIVHAVLECSFMNISEIKEIMDHR